MQNDDNNKPGKGLQPQQQNNLPAALATSKKLVQHLKTALAKSSRDLMAEDDGWVERLIRGLEAGINEFTEIKVVSEIESREQEFNYLPKNKDILLSLTHLDYSSTKWDVIEDEIYTNLKILPIEIGNLHYLQELILYGNQLTTLPITISQLCNLKELNLWGNRLTILPTIIIKLNNLQILNLGNNQLSSLATEISHLQNLQTLYLRDNQLTTLPEEIGQLQNLKWLNLRGNPLCSLPESLKRLYRERNGALTIWLDNKSLLKEDDDDDDDDEEIPF